MINYEIGCLYTTKSFDSTNFKKFGRTGVPIYELECTNFEFD